MIEADMDLKSAAILVVDDEHANVVLIETILNSHGYEYVYSTQDPSQVLGMYCQHNIDLILLDINMPVMDGYDVMAQLKALDDPCLAPILVLTAQYAQDFRQRAFDAGARDYVTKPFDVNELLSRVQNLLQAELAQQYMRKQNDILDHRVLERTVELQMAQQQLHENRLQVVRRLGRAAEFRDNETGLHIIRMSKIAALLGRAAGMNDEDCDLLLNAAPMHDIGKIGIPDDILLKPGRFDADEWRIMQSHVQIGADILSGDDSRLLVMAAEIALTHHEKWDGSGYPNGLKGEEIPLVGRLCALADVFDALTSKRPYKPAWSEPDALEYLVAESGRHFDPNMIEHFLALFPKIASIRHMHSEPVCDEITMQTRGGVGLSFRQPVNRLL